MKTKIIVVGTLVAVISGVVVLLRMLKKKTSTKTEKPKNPDVQLQKTDYESPESLLQCLLEKLVQENIYKNERDFQERLIKLFIEQAKSIEWVKCCPVSMEDMQERLKEFGLLKRFEDELEKKYTSKRN